MKQTLLISKEIFNEDDFSYTTPEEIWEFDISVNLDIFRGYNFRHMNSQERYNFLKRNGGILIEFTETII